MPLIPFKIAPAPTPASVFAAKYDFLLRWAQHFTQGDRAAAEDLVHETFLRFALQQEEIEDPENAEPLLYTYLKRVYSAQLRRTQRQRFVSLTTVEFDSLQMSLREQKDADPVKVQGDLRRILSYLCWRKETMKSASVMLFRFFHGYFPEEIMRVSLLARPSIDYALNAARDEVRLYLHEPDRLRIIHGEKTPDFRHDEFALPVYELMDDLRETLFRSTETACLPEETLLAYYRAEERRPISRELLAHIVSCRQCLDRVNLFQGRPPASSISSETILSQGKRAGSGFGKKTPSKSSGPQRLLEIGERRLREVLEHRPRALMICVNGEVVASQNVESTKNTQKIEVKDGDPLDLVEVLSEQGVCLLPILLRALPPSAPPEIRHEVELSDGRSIEACLTFNVHGCVIEVSYFDPRFFERMTDGALQVIEEELASSPTEWQLALNGESGHASLAAPKVPWMSKLANWIRKPNITPVRPLPAIGLGAVLAVIACVFIWLGMRPIAITANTLLVRSQAWDSAAVNGGQPGVVRQRLTIKSPGRRVDRIVYRDLQGRRRWKEQPLSTEDEMLRGRLTVAGIAWNEPLSATHYQDWHDHQHVRKDTIVRAGKHLLKLTTTVPDGLISEQSITVRDDDFHPVERSAAFRGGETVEIAEVDYEVLPWSRVEPGLFDPASEQTAPGNGTVRRPVALPHHSLSVPSDGDIDVAELSALLVLNRLHADTSEQIDIVRQPSGIQVKGIVATVERKRELEEQLGRVPHINPTIHTFEEMARLSAAQQQTTSIAAVSDVEQSTPLQRYLMARGWSRDDVGRLSQDLFNNAVAIERDSRAISQLEERFATKSGLAGSGRQALDELLAHHRESLKREVSDEEALLSKIGIAALLGDRNFSPFVSRTAEISQLAERVRALSKEMLSDTNAQARNVEQIVPELQGSLAQVRAIANKQKAASQAAQTVSPPPASPHDN
jgi:DNA-directed RNA polymerase specialized sigma24 family protein